MRHWILHKRLVLPLLSDALMVSVGSVVLIALFIFFPSLSYAQGLIATSLSHTCALTKALDGGVLCWGNNSSGQLGDDSLIQRKRPVEVYGLSSGVAAVGVGDGFSCALLEAGEVWCWGNNVAGQLGRDSIPSSKVPLPVLDSPGGSPLTGECSLWAISTPVLF